MYNWTTLLNQIYGAVWEQTKLILYALPHFQIEISEQEAVTRPGKSLTPGQYYLLCVINLPPYSAQRVVGTKKPAGEYFYICLLITFN